jgi:hypothetical protein
MSKGVFISISFGVFTSKSASVITFIVSSFSCDRFCSVHNSGADQKAEELSMGLIYPI